MAFGVERITTSAGRSYPFLSGTATGSANGTMFKINDTAAPWLSYLARTFPAELNKALASIGYEARKEMSAIMKAGEGPAGVSWAPMSLASAQFRSYTRAQNRADKKAGGTGIWKVTGTGSLFGKLYRAVGYKRDVETMSVRIGFLSYSAAILMKALQEGFVTSVTSRMRRKFNTGDLSGVGGSIIDPARPMVEPYYRQIEASLPGRIQNKILAYLDQAQSFSRAA
ncbi:hypothetical protein [Humidesulfovibrio idahonensis]